VNAPEAGAQRGREVPALGDDEEIKFTLPGPMTMVDTLYDEHYGSREKLAMAFAAILNQEARELAALGVDVIQFDEPAFNVYFDEVRDWGVAALEKARAGLTCTTAVHICYGYGIEANIKWKETLGAEWRQYEQTFPLLAKSSIDQVSLECANSHVPMELIGLLQGKDVLVGCIDVATTRVETPAGRRERDPRGPEIRPEGAPLPCTNCGMVPLAREVARGKLKALGDGAALMRKEMV
jgi:5-methyltetrahydropteroyltriglutamate--homocysteine methyltransferase